MYQKMSLLSLCFNRFILIRYATSFFLFLNLYWMIFLLASKSLSAILPAYLFLLSLLTAFEQIKLYRDHSNKLPYAQFLFRTQLIVCCLLLLSVYSPLYFIFFPFLMQEQFVMHGLIGLLMFSLFLSGLMLLKLNIIKHNRDKHYARILAYKQMID